MRITQSLVLIGAAAANVLLATTAGAQAVSRVIPRADLPGDFRQQLPRGEVARVSPAGVDTVAPATQVVLRPGEVLAVRTGDSAIAMPRQPGGGPAPDGRDSVFGLPFTYFGLDVERSTPTSYRPLYVPSGPLRYRAKEDDFLGTFLLGLQDSANPTSIRDLSAPVRMRFAGDADSVSPDSVVMRQTNAQMERIRVYVQVAFDSVRVLIVPPFDPRGVGVWLPVQPALAFEEAPRVIQGLGVEGATLVVGRRGTRSRDSTPVTLSTSRGSLETNRIFVADGGGVVRIRSAGVGPATISARAPGLVPAEVTIAYKWPIEFVTAALLGGLLGGVVAYMYVRRRSAASLGRFALKGILAGLLTCVAYLGLGINLLKFEVNMQYFNELAVFALAALAGAFGIVGLSAIAKSSPGR